MKGSPLDEFFCQVYNVATPLDIYKHPYGNRVWASDIPRNCVVPFEVSGRLDGAQESYKLPFHFPVDQTRMQPREPFMDPVTKKTMQYDTSLICTYSIICRHKWCDIDEKNSEIYLRLNMYNRHVAEIQRMEQMDRVCGTVTGVPGAFASVSNTEPKGEDMACAPVAACESGYQNEAFIRTMFYVTPENLNNGIIHIPHEVCVRAKLPVWRNEFEFPEELDVDITKMLSSLKIEPESGQAQQVRSEMQSQFKEQFDEMAANEPNKSDSFYAIPFNHVLAWGLNSETFRNQCGVQVHHYNISTNETGVTTLFYLMASERFKSHRASFCDAWLGKIDHHIRDNYAFEAIPKTATTRGTISLRGYISYVCGPQLNAATVAQLIPTLAEGFPHEQRWVQ